MTTDATAARWIVLVCAMWSAILACAQPGYIRLDGDQFIDEHGQPFFPVVMNYYVDYFYTTASNSFPLTPTLQEVNTLNFGRSSLWSCSGQYNYPAGEGEERLLQDFTEMKAQGFNTIRFVSNAVKKDGPGFALNVKHHNTGQGQVGVHMGPPYDPDPNLNPVLWFHFNAILAVCSLANSLDMKMIVEPVLGGEFLEVDLGDANNLDHIAFLEAFATFISNNDVHNLLAYEFFGEPTFDDEVDTDNGVYHTKADICAIANSWTTAIRGIDTDHLLTIGSVYHTDVMRQGWDPMLIDVDFASVHVYPLVDRWEYDQDPNTFRAAATERYNNMIRFYDKYMKKPYMITETGFAAEDPFEACSTTPNPLIGYPLTCSGDEGDQNDFLEATFAGIRDSRCAGYGWWIFMNMHWLPEPTPGNINDRPMNGWEQRYFGIMRFGDPVYPPAPGTTGWESSRKQAAQTMADWVSNPPPAAPLAPIPAVLDMNDRYFNQYMHPPNNVSYDDPMVAGSPDQYGTLTGQVVDQNGTPFAGAIIHANNATHLEWNADDMEFQTQIRAYVTYSDNNGSFSIRALDNVPGVVNPTDNGTPGDLTGIGDRTVKDIKIAGYASELVQANTHFDQGATYQINTLQLRIDGLLENEHVPVVVTGNFDALASLTATNVHIEGASDIKARYEVHLTANFHAEQGSETHIYTEPVFFDCNEILNADLRILDGGGGASHTTRVVEERATNQMELQFSLPISKSQLVVRPNPTSGLIAGVLTHSQDLHPPLKYVLTDPQGRRVLQGTSASEVFTLDLSSLSPSIYSLTVTIGEHAYEQNIIKQ